MVSLVSFKKLFKQIKSRIQLRLGCFTEMKHIDFEVVERLVFVCRGNVCRSPYAEAVAQSQGKNAISCGVDVKYSAPAEKTGVDAAKMRGIDLSGHMSRSIYDVQLCNTDCLVAMDPSHLPISRTVALQIGCQVTLIGLWSRTPVAEIADPYSRPLDTFRQCFNEIDNAMLGILEHMRTNERTVES